MENEIEDSLFGILKWSNDIEAWETRRYIDLFNKEIDILVYPSDDMPVRLIERQKQTFKKFLEDKNHWEKIIEQSIFEHYVNYECEAVRDSISDLEENEIDEIAPLINNSKDINKLINPLTLKIYNEQISISYDCTWETHGLGIILKNRKVSYIASASEV